MHTLYYSFSGKKANEIAFEYVSLWNECLCVCNEIIRTMSYTIVTENLSLIFIKSIKNILFNEYILRVSHLTLKLAICWRKKNRITCKFRATPQWSLTRSLFFPSQFIFITRTRKILCSKLKMAHLTYWYFWLVLLTGTNDRTLLRWK